MFEKLSNDDLRAVIDELISLLGVKEVEPFQDLVTRLEEGDTEGCVQGIADRLNLPIRISLSYVSKDFKAGDTDRFVTDSLVKINSAGSGTESITAQVSIPPSLPLYGSSRLQGYIIPIRVSEDCYEHAKTFISMVAHELSHVLLAALAHPKKLDELYTDIVPIILGFSDIIWHGRKVIKTTTSGNTTTTETTTYGYLTDSQFQLAYSRVHDILRRHRRDKKHLIEVIEQISNKIEEGLKGIAKFRDYLRFLDMHPPRKMKREYAQRLVQLHAQDYSIEWENSIKDVRRIMECAQSFVRSLNHYTSSSIEQLKIHTRQLEIASARIDPVIEALIQDNKILQRYVGFWRSLWHKYLS